MSDSIPPFVVPPVAQSDNDGLGPYGMYVSPDIAEAVTTDSDNVKIRRRLQHLLRSASWLLLRLSISIPLSPFRIDYASHGPLWNVSPSCQRHLASSVVETADRTATPPPSEPIGRSEIRHMCQRNRPSCLSPFVRHLVSLDDTARNSIYLC
jgi:hypothetical protein